MLFATLNFTTLFFTLFAGMAGFFAIAVVLSNHIVRMACYLILSLGASSGLFFLAGAGFLGALQLMVYVGATVVLLLFGVMLTTREEYVSMQIKRHELILHLLLGCCLLLFFVSSILQKPQWRTPNVPANEQATMQRDEQVTTLGAGLVGLRFDRASYPASLQRGVSGYFLPFILVSVHLLVVLIGAAYLARTKVLRTEQPTKASLPN